MQDDSFEIVQPKISQKKQVEEEKVPISSDFIQAAIKDAIKNDGATSEESSDSEEQVQIDKKMKKKGPKNKKPKAEKPGLPKKAFKKLIKKELDKQCGQILNDLYNNPQATGEGQIPSSRVAENQEEVVHERVECDGCGKAPILGVRYKCSICKDFDFCATCEDKKGHEHAMLKITNPKQAPKAIIAIVDENMQNPQADMDFDVNQMRNMASQFAQCFKGDPQSESQGPNCAQTAGGPPNTAHTPFGGQGVRLDN